MAHSVPSFGRRAQMVAPGPEGRLASGLGDDLRLFALTFTAGFLFVSVYLA